MNVRVFHIRLTKDNLQVDQEKLNSFLDSVKVIKTAHELINGQTNFWSILVFYEAAGNSSAEKLEVTSEEELTEDEKKIYETLKQWRQDRASELNVPNYVVAHNKHLITIAKIKPEKFDDFLKIKGYGEKKASQYAEDIIALLNSI